MDPVPCDRRCPSDAVAREAILRRHCETIAQEKMDASLQTLFHDLTGRNFEVDWRPALDWEQRMPLGGKNSCGLRAKAGRTDERCRESERRSLAQLRANGSGGLSFVCPHGVKNHWTPIRVLGLCLGVLLLRVPYRGSKTGRNGLPAGRAKKPTAPFERAARLLDLLAEHLRDAVLAEVQGENLHALEQQIESYKHRHRSVPHGEHVPFCDDCGFRDSDDCENHQERLVHHIVRCIHDRYGEPLSLQEFADELHMNRAHLSTLFSRIVGLPFRSYVKTLRLQAAEELLRDPIARISEVAYAVGYSDPNRFRLDFKSRTGLSPTAWRDVFG